MPSPDRDLRKAAGDLVRSARRAVDDPSRVHLAELRMKAHQAAQVLAQTGNVIYLLELPQERRGPIGTHNCGAESWEIRKGQHWVVWCQRCGYLPRIWRVKRRVEEMSVGRPASVTLVEPPKERCGDCLCYNAEQRDCIALDRSTGPDDEPILDDCFIPEKR